MLTELFRGTDLVCCASAVSCLLCIKSLVLNFTHWQKEGKKKEWFRTEKCPEFLIQDDVILWNITIFRHFRKIAKSDYRHRYVCPSICVSVRPHEKNSAPTGRIFMKFRKSCRLWDNVEKYCTSRQAIAYYSCRFHPYTDHECP